MEDCKHVRRDNNFGVTWCIKCGRLFNKPCGKKLTKADLINATDIRLKKAMYNTSSKAIGGILSKD